MIGNSAVRAEAAARADRSAGRGLEARVPTRFVRKYTLRARLEPSGPHEAVEGSTGHARELGDGGLGNAQLEEATVFTACLWKASLGILSYR